MYTGKYRIFEIIARVALLYAIIMSIVFIYQALRYLFGGSWGAVSLIIAIFSIGVPLIVYIVRGIEALKIEARYLRRDMDKVERRMDKIEIRMDKIETRLSGVEQRMEKMDNRLERIERILSRSPPKRA